jgi:hypothetical protein
LVRSGEREGRALAVIVKFYQFNVRPERAHGKCSETLKNAEDSQWKISHYCLWWRYV